MASNIIAAARGLAAKLETITPSDRVPLLSAVYSVHGKIRRAYLDALALAKDRARHRGPTTNDNTFEADEEEVKASFARKNALTDTQWYMPKSSLRHVQVTESSLDLTIDLWAHTLAVEARARPEIADTQAITMLAWIAFLHEAEHGRDETRMNILDPSLSRYLVDDLHAPRVNPPQRLLVATMLALGYSKAMIQNTLTIAKGSPMDAAQVRRLVLEISEGLASNQKSSCSSQ